MAIPTSDDQERAFHALYAANMSAARYREVLGPLMGEWRGYNTSLFDGRLKEPHIAIGRTAPRSLVHCTRLTGYGAPIGVVFNEGMMFGPNSAEGNRPWPTTPGRRRFIGDLFLRVTTCQYVIEVVEPALEAERGHEVRDGHGGFGVLYCNVANAIRTRIGVVDDVVPRDRPTRFPETPLLLAKYWPHCCRVYRDPGYYGDDVSPHLLDLACGTAIAGRRLPIRPDLGLLEYLHMLLTAKKADQALAIITTRIQQLEAVQRRKDLKRNRRMEAGELDTNGEPLGYVAFDRDWNASYVRHMVQTVQETRDFSLFPILADALEDAGCGDARILRHLRDKKLEHTKHCWVLKGLLLLSG